MRAFQIYYAKYCYVKDNLMVLIKAYANMFNVK